MKNRKMVLIASFLVILALAILPACSTLPLLSSGSLTGTSPSMSSTPVALATSSPTQAAVPQSAVSASGQAMLSAYEGVLSDIFNRVNPSVVYIRVVSQVSSSTLPGFPFGFPQDNTPQYQEGVGSGFVWDKEGHIVTNNHVVDGADKIEVTFSDGTIVNATLIGADPDSDLAVLKVDVPADQLQPVQMGDSTQVKVGQLAIAIGNPFGLQNTMTVGIISALGRTLPAGSASASGGTYSIPNIIQTDAPINPGNSGGVLVNDRGEVIGVTSAIESPVRANAGIGFVIPSQVVSKVVPVLIKDGKYEHSWLGISGVSLTPTLAKASNLDENQRGVLIGEVTPGSPAEKAGLKGSDQTVEVDGQQLPKGGDVITAIDGQPVRKIEDLISYLATDTVVGQKVTLTILRNGKEQSLEVVLAARPSQEARQSSSSSQAGEAYLGVSVVELDASIARSVGLKSTTRGLLVQRVDPNGPAGEAGIRGGSRPVLANGQIVLAGGDVLQKMDDLTLNTITDLQDALSQHNPGDEVTITLLRNGKQIELPVTLGSRSQ